ncbi:MAG: cadmium-translocating P-type ATPase [Alphaproteobacteria bacterium]|nr:cadmium-translocating P-type ATPase [Alphaproteobacteria bacterium]
MKLDIQGMTCATCSTRVEKVLRNTPGVDAASVNLATETATVAADTATLDALVQAVEGAGYGARAHVPGEPVVDDAFVRSGALVVGAGVLAAALMLPMFGVPLPKGVELALAIPAQLIAWWRFGPPAWGALKHGTANMDTLVVLGTTAAFGLSVVNYGTGPLYFESAATISAFVLFGKWLEHRARGRTTEAVRELLELRPETARVVRDAREIEVPAETVGRGQVVRVLPGERVPVDGTVREGHSSLDESLLTGESVPVERGPGSPVIGGSINGNGTLLVETTASGSDTALARIAALVEEALASKAPIQALVDRVASVFVPTVLAIATLTFGGWLIAGAGLQPALMTAVAVLVVACPCALGLATPAALVAGMGSAARAGIFIRDADALETLASLRTIAFDKTGTLTVGQPELRTPLDPDVLRLAVAVQKQSSHPLARAFQRAAPADVPAATEVREHPGQGVSGKVEGHLVRLGTAGFLTAEGLTLPAGDVPPELTPVWIAVDDGVRGVVGVGDALRDGVAEAIQRVRALGMEPALISGDRTTVAEAIGRQAGITHVVAEARPETKVAAIQALQGPVGMVGDGVNDAPALAAADVGIAMGSGSQAAIASAPVTLTRTDPRLVPAAVDIGRRTQAIIRENLFWAFAYNVVAIPLAVAGWLTPMVAAGAMAMSSVTVVANALRLRTWSPD